MESLTSSSKTSIFQSLTFQLLVVYLSFSVLVFSVFFLLSPTVFAVQFPNADFELGTPGKTPPKWQANENSHAVISLENPLQGKQCVRLHRGSLSQSVDASALAGRRIVVTVGMNLENQSIGELALTLQGEQGLLWQDKFEIRDQGWQQQQLLVDVPQAKQLELTLQAGLKAGSSMTFDAVHINNLGPSGQPSLRPTALPETTVARLAAFTRLYAYTRWFNPSDQAVHADWDRIAVEGVRIAETSTDAAQFATDLQALLQPATPNLQIWSQQAPAIPPAPSAKRKVAWYHLGPGLNNSVQDPQSFNQPHPMRSAYERFRIDNQNGWRKDLKRTIMLRTIDASAWREETVQVVVQATITGSLQAKLQLRAAGSNRQAETTNLDGSKSSLLLTLPANADDLHLSLALQGDGDIAINELTIQPLRVGATTRVLSAAAGLGIQGLLVGTLGLLGAVVSRRTIGGFVAALVGMLAFFQISQIGPEIAYWLPTVHMNNLQSRWTGDAEGLVDIENHIGSPIHDVTSLLIFGGWIVAMLAIASTHFDRTDIRGGGD